MPSPLLVVFLLQLTLVVVDTLGAQYINELLYILYCQITFTPVSAAAKESAALRKQVMQLRAELNATSAQDDFAKWAKLRRQFDKLQAEYEKKAASQTTDRSTFNSRVGTFRFVFINGARLYIQWSYSREPMFWLPKGWIPWYVEWLLSFPRAPQGSVSVQVWQMACGSALAMVVEAVKSLIALAQGKIATGAGEKKQPMAVPASSKAGGEKKSK